MLRHARRLLKWLLSHSRSEIGSGSLARAGRIRSLWGRLYPRQCCARPQLLRVGGFSWCSGNVATDLGLTNW